MSDPKAMTIISAKHAIAQILKELEEATDSVVEGIRLEQLDVSTYGGPRPQRLVSVEIDLARLPGHDWTVG